MTKTEIVYDIAKKLHIFSIQLMASILSSLGYFAEGDSSYQNAYKIVNNELVPLGKLIKVAKGIYAIPECRSLWKDHARLLSVSVGEFLKLPFESVVHREHSIQSVNLRIDALIFLKNKDSGRLIIYEERNTELEAYTNLKRHALENLPLDYFSQLFNYEIPSYDFVTSEELKTYLEEIKDEAI